MKIKTFITDQDNVASFEKSVNAFLSTGIKVRHVTQLPLGITESMTCVWYENDPPGIANTPWFKRPISSLHLCSVRAERAISNANIQTLGQLCSKTEHEMLGYRNFGKGSLNIVKDKLAKHGLGFGMQID